jgi:hypothetical protein
MQIMLAIDTEQRGELEAMIKDLEEENRFVCLFDISLLQDIYKYMNTQG